jgi:hypothetical protein
MGALDEAAILVARDELLTDEVALTFERLLDGLRSGSSRRTRRA